MMRRFLENQQICTMKWPAEIGHFKDLLAPTGQLRGSLSVASRLTYQVYYEVTKLVEQTSITVRFILHLARSNQSIFVMRN